MAHGSLYAVLCIMFSVQKYIVLSTQLVYDVRSFELLVATSPAAAAVTKSLNGRARILHNKLHRTSITTTDTEHRLQSVNLALPQSSTVHTEHSLTVYNEHGPLSHVHLIITVTATEQPQPPTRSPHPTPPPATALRPPRPGLCPRRVPPRQVQRRGHRVLPRRRRVRRHGHQGARQGAHVVRRRGHGVPERVRQ